MLGMICNALKEISETNTGTNVVINVVTNEGKIIRYGANRNGYWEIVEQKREKGNRRETRCKKEI